MLTREEWLEEEGVGEGDVLKDEQGAYILIEEGDGEKPTKKYLPGFDNDSNDNEEENDAGAEDENDTEDEAEEGGKEADDEDQG